MSETGDVTTQAMALASILLIQSILGVLVSKNVISGEALADALGTAVKTTDEQARENPALERLMAAAEDHIELIRSQLRRL